MTYVIEERPGGGGYYWAWIYMTGLPPAVGYRTGFTREDVRRLVRAAYPEAIEAERPPSAYGWLLITDGR